MSRNDYVKYADEDFMHEEAPKEYPAGTTPTLVKDYDKTKVKGINEGSDLRSDNKASKKV